VTVEEAVQALRDGAIVCFPTETFYGLAVDALSETAVARLVAAKGREEGKPVAVIAPDLQGALLLWAEPAPQAAVALAGKHWPGPLTLVVAAREGIPAALVNPDGGVGVRVSSHPVAARLATLFGGPITATSANLAGQPPVTTCAAARQALGDRVSVYLDGGTTPGGPASTVVAVAADGGLALLRPGAVAFPP
jgi:L-threonylcarbamoyladenylate synthase